MSRHDKGGFLLPGWSEAENKTGQDLVINAPCAAASATSPMHGTEPDINTEEAGDGLD